MGEEEQKGAEDIPEGIREIVVPGELLQAEGMEAGVGTYRDGAGIYSAFVGVKSVRAGYINVIPLAGRYAPRTGDSVIGVVVDLGPSNWVIDISGPHPATLHTSEVPWKVDFGDTARYLAFGDSMLAKVALVDETRRVQVTMNGVGLRKLEGGEVVDVSPSKVPRLIGKGGSMIRLLKNMTRCRIFVGQNGRIWLDGTPEDIRIASLAVRRIEKEAHTYGLTESMEKYLTELRGNTQ